jgi:hypothetical protein
MPKIIVSNIRSEYAEDVLDRTPLPVGTSWRHLWFAEEGDAVVTADPVDVAYLEYVGRTLGIDPGTLLIVPTGGVVSDQLLRSEEVIAPLREWVSANPGRWSVMPCFYTPAVSDLAVAVGISADRYEFAAQRGIDLMNRKSHFRQLAAGIDLPIASGSSARTLGELRSAISRCVDETGTVILKQDSSGGGHGNLALSTDSDEPLPGTRDVLRIERDSLGAAAEYSWQELSSGGTAPVVVEAYHHKPRAIFYFEYEIDARGIPQFLNSGDVKFAVKCDDDGRQLPWEGLTIPADVSPYQLANALSHATRFAALAGSMGYRGYLNIDAIVTRSGKLIFNEVNGRWGGGLVLHFLAARLLSSEYADSRVVASVRNLRSLRMERVLEILEKASIAYPNEAGEGVVVTALGPAEQHTMECVIIGCTRENVLHIENELRRLLAIE